MGSYWGAGDTIGGIMFSESSPTNLRSSVTVINTLLNGVMGGLATVITCLLYTSIPLTAADPDYPVAPEIQEAMMDYVKDGYFSYTPKLGYPEFRDSISKALMERKGEEIDPNLILPIDSAARGMYAVSYTHLLQQFMHRGLKKSRLC